MINGLTEMEKFKVIRPIIGNCEYDKYNMPVIKKVDKDSLDWENMEIIGLQNISPNNADKNKLVIMFNYDKKLLSLWNEPLKKIGLFQSYAAIATPDFSLYPKMNINEIQHNIFMSRWLGVTWQNYGCTVIPTVGWATPETYDICFSGIEKQSIVIISTLGCHEHSKEFLDGFNELKKRIEPSLIIVFGDMIKGMTGTFINFKYKDSFNVKKQFKQLRFKEISQIFTIKEDI